jgi:galactokinase
MTSGLGVGEPTQVGQDTFLCPRGKFSARPHGWARRRGCASETVVKFFVPSFEPAEGLGVLLLFRLIEEAVPAFFRSDRSIAIARAPGRLEVAADGSGRALHLPIAEGACVAVQQRDDDLVRLWSPCRDGSRTQMLSMRLADLGLPERPVDDDEARALLCGDPRDRWAAYLLGGLLFLARGHGLVPQKGADVLLYSDVPQQCGVASSSAVTAAGALAFARLYGLALEPDAVVTVCHHVESRVLRSGTGKAGAAAAVWGRSGELLDVDEGTGAVVGRIAVPSDLEFVALDSGQRAGPGSGAAVWAGDATFVADCRQGLASPPSPKARHALGDAMFVAHDRAAAGGGSTPAADVAVAAARSRRDAGGAVLGARVSGRGGAVVIVGEHGKVWLEALRIKKAVLTATGHSGHVFRWSSPGAQELGGIELEPRGEA